MISVPTVSIVASLFTGLIKHTTNSFTPSLLIKHTERKRQQVLHLVEKGAYLRLGSVIHVQSRGWAKHHPRLIALPESAKLNGTDSSLTQEIPPSLLAEDGVEGSSGVHISDVRDDVVEGLHDGEHELSRTSGRRLEGNMIYPKQDLERRKVHMLSQRCE